MKPTNIKLFGVVFLLLFIGSVIASLKTGPVTTSFVTLAEQFFNPDLTQIEGTVLWQLRLPRVLLSLIVGALLALCGAFIQGLFRNPLAEPGLLGVSSGATLMVVVLWVLIPEQWLIFSNKFNAIIRPMMAFTGGLIATYLVMLIGRSDQPSSLRLILAGVAFNMVAAAAIGLCAYLASDEQLRTLTFWNLGSFSTADWPAVYSSGLVLCVLAWFSFRLHRPLNALLLGEAEAHHLGYRVRPLKRLLIVLSAAGVAAAVAFTGIIGFVGLVVPHLVRLLVGADHKTLLPLSMMGGALLTLWADWLARSLISPAELPVGIITSLLGGPFFIYLIHRHRRVLS